MLGEFFMGLHIKKLNIPHYEEVIEIKDSSRGLHAFIAIHDTTFGPALGGIRLLPYPTAAEALTDVLRLSKGMTYKSTLAGLPVGGGKSTIILDPAKGKTKEMFHAFGEAINYLEGRYIGAEDMNCSEEDVQTIFEVCPHILGLPGEGTGDPARFTVRGTFVAILATAKHLWGSTCLKGKKIAIQGLGGVGSKLLDQLFWAGADLYVSDIRPEVVKSAVHQYGATAVAFEEIYDLECDIFAPCARGGILNEKSIKNLRCKAIVGAANNQLLTEEDGQRLKDRGILYAPDYLVNCGGVISVASALTPSEIHPQKVLFKTDAVFDRLLEIYKLAEQKNICTSVAADQIVEQLLQAAKEKQNVMV